MSSQVKADGARPKEPQVPRISCLHFPSPSPRAAVPHSPTFGEGEKKELRHLQSFASGRVTGLLRGMAAHEVSRFGSISMPTQPQPRVLSQSLHGISRGFPAPWPRHGLLGSGQRAALRSLLWFAVGCGGAGGDRRAKGLGLHPWVWQE